MFRASCRGSERELDRVLPDPCPSPCRLPPAAVSRAWPRRARSTAISSRVTYGELTKRPPFGVRLSHIWSGPTLAFALLEVIGLFGTIFTFAQGPLFETYSRGETNLVVSIQYLVSVLLLFIGSFLVIWAYIQVERFYEYRNQRLRSIYLRSEGTGEDSSGSMTDCRSCSTGKARAGGSRSVARRKPQPFRRRQDRPRRRRCRGRPEIALTRKA